MKKNKQLTRGNKMRNKMKKIAGSLIALAIVSAVASTEASAYTNCTGYWVGNTWNYSCR